MFASLFILLRAAHESDYCADFFDLVLSVRLSRFVHHSAPLAAGLSFYMLLGGVSEGWQTCLSVAVVWVRARWPEIKRLDRKFRENAKTFVALTVWYDILGAVSLRRRPLLEAILVDILKDDSIVQLDQVMGCDNKVRRSFPTSS